MQINVNHYITNCTHRVKDNTNTTKYNMKIMRDFLYMHEGEIGKTASIHVP